MEPQFHKRTQEVEEHGRTWTVCNYCGAQWNSDDEQITEGDGACEEALSREERGERSSCGPRYIDHENTHPEPGRGEVCDDCGAVVKG